MAHAKGEHRRLILDQFTRQAVPFSQMRDHSPGLILAAAEVRPDVTEKMASLAYVVAVAMSLWPGLSVALTASGNEAMRILLAARRIEAKNSFNPPIGFSLDRAPRLIVFFLPIGAAFPGRIQ